MTLQLRALILSLSIASLFGIYMKGRHDGAATLKAQLDILHAQVTLQEAHYEEVAKKANEAHAALAVQNASTLKQAHKIAALPAYRHECLDVEGVRIANDALRNAASGTPATLP